VQADVVAINWRQKAILLGEGKWGADPVGRKVLTGLVAKTSLTVPDRGQGWRVYYALFSRAGFTRATRDEATMIGAILVDLAQLDHDLGESLA